MLSQYDEQEPTQRPPERERHQWTMPRQEWQEGDPELLNDYSYRRGYAAQQYPSSEESEPAGPQEPAAERFSEQQMAPQVSVTPRGVPWWARPQKHPQQGASWPLALPIVVALALCGSPFILTFAIVIFTLTVIGLAFALGVGLLVVLTVGAVGLLLAFFGNQRLLRHLLSWPGRLSRLSWSRRWFPWRWPRR